MTYSKPAELLKRRNIVPLYLEMMITHNGTTLPPIPITKRTSGHPRKIRLRKHSRFAYEPENLNITCSNCGQKGHNVRTCLLRQSILSEGDNKNSNRNDANHTRTETEEKKSCHRSKNNIIGGKGTNKCIRIHFETMPLPFLDSHCGALHCL